MVRDESILDTDMSAPHLDEKYQLLFGTESIYLFLRLYTFICSILSETRGHCATFPPPQNPALSYFNPYKDNVEVKAAPASKLNFSKVVAALKKVVSNDMDEREFEALGRRITKEKVHQFAALPKLIERCASCLIKSAKEDALLHLYDCSHHSGVDPVVVRTHCFAVAPAAPYRIQYERSSGELCFSYVPKGKELLTAPSDDIRSFSDEEGADANGGAVSMVIQQEDDPIEEYDGEGEPSAKRQKVI